MIDLEAIKARYAKATSGPWEDWVEDTAEEEESSLYLGSILAPIKDSSGRDTVIQLDCSWLNDQLRYASSEQLYDNLEFIAHAREDIPALVAEIERLRAEKKK